MGAAPAPTPPHLIASTPAKIRAFLANRYVYKDWYHQVRRVAMRGHLVKVIASLSGGTGGRRAAEEICRAVLGSRAAARIVVEYAHDSATCR